MKPYMSGARIFQITVPGKCIPQGRPRATCIRGKPRLYDPARSRAYKAAVRALMQIHARKTKWKTADSEAWVFIRVRYKGKPIADVDNCAKGLIDAAQMAGIIDNDNRVLSLTVEKENYAKDNEVFFELGFYPEDKCRD